MRWPEVRRRQCGSGEREFVSTGAARIWQLAYLVAAVVIIVAVLVAFVIAAVDRPRHRSGSGGRYRPVVPTGERSGAVDAADVHDPAVVEAVGGRRLVRIVQARLVAPAGSRPSVGSGPSVAAGTGPSGDEGAPVGDVGAPAGDEGDAATLAAVEERLGRSARGAFAVVVVDAGDGAPVVIRNEPLLADGTPMPTRYWLVDPELGRRIGTLENAGGVRWSEAEVDPEALAEAHRRYAAERDAHLPEGWTGPRPSGGVGGTRRGVKCLHTHYANWLATGDDPVGAWVHRHLSEADGSHPT